MTSGYLDGERSRRASPLIMRYPLEVTKPFSEIKDQASGSSLLVGSSRAGKMGLQRILSVTQPLEMQLPKTTASSVQGREDGNIILSGNENPPLGGCDPEVTVRR